MKHKWFLVLASAWILWDYTDALFPRPVEGFLWKWTCNLEKEKRTSAWVQELKRDLGGGGVELIKKAVPYRCFPSDFNPPRGVQ